MSVSDVAESSLPRPAMCREGAARGLACLPVVPGTDYCAQHHPDQAEERRQRASAAARRSHAHRLKPLNLGPEFTVPDFTSATSRVAFRQLVAAARIRGALDDKAAGTLLSAVNGSMQDSQPRGGPSKPGLPPVVVDVFGRNSNGDDAA